MRGGRGEERDGVNRHFIMQLFIQATLHPAAPSTNTAATLHSRHRLYLAEQISFAFGYASSVRCSESAFNSMQQMSVKGGQPLSVDDDKICLQNGNFLVSDHVTFFPLPAFLATFLQKHIPTLNRSR